MKRITLLHYTGARARNLKVARRIARKIVGALRNGECLLIDCEDTEVSADFLKELTVVAHPEKIRFCGLPQPQQQALPFDERQGEL